MGEKFIFAALLVFLIACQPETHTIPTSEYQPPVDASVNVKVQQTNNLCKDINCTIGKVCKEGTCMCPSGKKVCEDDCIPASDCCTYEDCKSGSCEDGNCVEAQECRLKEEFKKGECQCDSNSFYCKEQGKCLKRGSCCVHTECDRFERCVPTNWRASFCIKIDDKKICEIISDLNRTETFDVKDNEFKVKPTDWWSDESVSLLVNNESMRLVKDETKLVEEINATLFHEGVEITGGFCKEDED